MPEGNTATSQGQTPNSVDPTGQTPNTAPNGQTPNGTPPKTAFESLPQDIQDMITGLRNENKDKRKTIDAIEAEKKLAEEQKLREQGEFQKLAEQHQARVKELEPTVERYQKLSDLVHEQIKAQVKEWPDEVKTLVPDKNTPVEERLTALEKLKPLAEKFAVQARGAQPGNAPNPRPSDNVGSTDVKSAMERLRASGTY